jgi:uncharacterized membrane protein YvbJ
MICKTCGKEEDGVRKTYCRACRRERVRKNSREWHKADRAERKTRIKKHPKTFWDVTAVMVLDNNTPED